MCLKGRVFKQADTADSLSEGKETGAQRNLPAYRGTDRDIIWRKNPSRMGIL